MKWARAADALTLDPHGQNEGPTIAFNGQVYEALIWRDNSNKLVPALATSWKMVDPTTWEFKLRPNVKFHNGEAFTADDVVFSFQRALQPTSDYKGYLANTKEIVKVDDLTVHLKTNAPNPLVPDNLTTVYIMSKSWCEEHKATRAKHPAGPQRGGEFVRHTWNLRPVRFGLFGYKDGMARLTASCRAD